MSNNSSTDSSDPLSACLKSQTELFIFTSFFVVNVFLLPVFTFILFTGWQRWRRQRSGSTATPTSHSDVFTYNLIVLELVSIVGCGLYCYGAFAQIRSVIQVVEIVFLITSAGQSLFHVLTCVERYLAVVHPITYLSLRRSGGVRIRNICIGGVWLLCLVSLSQTAGSGGSTHIIVQSCFLVFFLSLVTFCSVSVLRVLIRPGPGERGGDKPSVDQSKQRAFLTITAIMGALLLRFVGLLVGSLKAHPKLAMCTLNLYAAWFTVPGSLVLPLLFLHRAGKLPGCRRTTNPNPVSGIRKGVCENKRQTTT